VSFIAASVSVMKIWNATEETHENKVLYLLTEWKKQFTNKDASISYSGYPLLRKVEYSNPWEDYLIPSDSLPNFVFIIVEGLGSDFVNNGKYSGFTPFLDSLSQKSLYWKNALSNAGRTFGAVPSVFGSLPNGNSGFMNLGQDMPLHQTLFSLLKPYGYHTNFFYGGNPNFDNLDLFLEHQNLDEFINSTNFPSRVTETNSNKHWGYADEALFQLGAEVIKNQSGQRVDCYLTLSTHEPFTSTNI